MILFKLVLGLVCTGIIFGVSLLIMIHGWGLVPQSWGWIIGGYIVVVVAGLIPAIFGEL
jgi:hypothetical protein